MKFTKLIKARSNKEEVIQNALGKINEAERHLSETISILKTLRPYFKKLRIDDNAAISIITENIEDIIQSDYENDLAALRDMLDDLDEE